jgi:16S rRNA (guanine527-N7)-methyltransferase
VNLTGARTPEDRVRVLVSDPWTAHEEIQGKALIDIGSGNGSPGIVLALLRPDLATTLLEPRLKRWAFLREAARTLGRPEVTVLRERHDTYRGSPASTLTLRALALPLEDLAPLVLPGGEVLVFGGSPREGGPFRRAGETALPTSTLFRFRCST